MADELLPAQARLVRWMADLGGWVFASGMYETDDNVAHSLKDRWPPLVSKGTRDGRATWELTAAGRAAAAAQGAS